MKTKIMFFSLVAFCASISSNAQENKLVVAEDSSSDCGSYLVWANAGLPILFGTHTGDFIPNQNIRAGFGYGFQYYQVYGVIDWTSYKFDVPDALMPPFLSSGHRNDVTVYALGSLMHTVYGGIGMYYSHQDNVIGHDRSGNIIYQSGEKTHYGLFYCFGIGYRIRITDAVSLPYGFYYYNEDHQEYFYSSGHVVLYLGVQWTLPK